VENVVVVKYRRDVPMTEARPLVGRHVERASEVPGRDGLRGHAHVLCSSATGRPKGIVHTLAATSPVEGHDEMVFDLQEDDIRGARRMSAG